MFLRPKSISFDIYSHWKSYHPHKKKIDAIKSMPPPQNIKELSSTDLQATTESTSSNIMSTSLMH